MNISKVTHLKNVYIIYYKTMIMHSCWLDHMKVRVHSNPYVGPETRNTKYKCVLCFKDL